MSRIGGGLVAALLLLVAGCGALLLVDRPGLRAEYFALGPPWSGGTLGKAVGSPGLADASEVGAHLATPVLFSIRWRGWWEVEQAGEHRFYLDADDGGYLRVDGQPVVDAPGDDGERAASGVIELAPGFHEIEIGYWQDHGEARFTVHWVAPGGHAATAASLPLGDLYAGRLPALRKLLRRVGAGWAQPYRQLLGVLLLSAGLSLLGSFVRLPLAGLAPLRARLSQVSRRGLALVLLSALFLVVFAAVFPYTGTVRGGDDTSYLDTATFGVKTWYVSRYCHVYLLRLFVVLCDGDPLLGVRVWWSFVLAATVCALAVAVRSIGRGWQPATLAATLFVFMAQPTVWGLIGAGYADFSAMLFVTAATATCLHGLARERERPPPRRDWHALGIGALTAAAMRSKEVGAVLLLLPLLFAIDADSRLDLRRFVRRLAWWLAGAAAVLCVLTLLDGWILGDPFYTWDRERLAVAKQMNFPEHVGPREETWLDVVWYGHETRMLWLGVVAAAIAAGATRRDLRLRLLHLLPVAYLLAIIALYVRLPHPFSDRMLIPIVPVACLMTALLLHYAGLDEVPWRRLARPAVLVPGGLAAAAVFLIVVPLQRGILDPAALLPVERLARYGWEPRQFLIGMLLPAAVLVAMGGAALAAGRPSLRLAVLATALLVVYGAGCERSRSSLASRWAVQTSRLLVYPWQTFRAQLDSPPVQEVALSADLRGIYRMTAHTRSSLAKLALGRRDVFAGVVQDLPVEVPVAIASRNTYLAWLRELPTLADTATFGPGGFLVLVRPAEASERLRRLPAGPRAESAAERGVAERLEALRTSRDAAERRDLLAWIVANPLGRNRRSWDDLLSLQGAQLRAVALHPDGWTHGTRAAGLVVDNRAPSPLAQAVTLAVGDATRRLPVEVFFDDGERVAVVRFDRAEPRTVELAPVPPFTTRLFVVWSDSEWTPGGGDPRALGVQVRAPGPP